MQLCYSCSLESIRLPLQSICTAEEEAIERADQLEAKVKNICGPSPRVDMKIRALILRY